MTGGQFGIANTANVLNLAIGTAGNVGGSVYGADLFASGLEAAIWSSGSALSGGSLNPAQNLTNWISGK